MNQKLTAIHQEVRNNLESIHEALLRMNGSIQFEGTFGMLKWDKSYKSNRQIMMRPDIKLPQPFASWSNSL